MENRPSYLDEITFQISAPCYVNAISNLPEPVEIQTEVLELIHKEQMKIDEASRKELLENSDFSVENELILHKGRFFIPNQSEDLKQFLLLLSHSTLWICQNKAKVQAFSVLEAPLYRSVRFCSMLP